MLLFLPSTCTLFVAYASTEPADMAEIKQVPILTDSLLVKVTGESDDGSIVETK